MTKKLVVELSEVNYEAINCATANEAAFSLRFPNHPGSIYLGL